MAESSEQSQSGETRDGRRHEYRFLSNVCEASVVNDDGPTPVKARRMGFSRRSLEVFGAVLIGTPAARFRLWLYPETQPLRPECVLRFGETDSWRIVGVVERVIDGELVSHEVMAARYGD